MIIPDDGDPNWTLGNRVARIDVEEKVLGAGKYPDDFYLDGMLYGSSTSEVNMRVPESFPLIHPKPEHLPWCGSSGDSRRYSGREQDRTSET